MKIRTASQRKKNATSELAPSTFAPQSDDFEPSNTAPPLGGHSFSNLSVRRPIQAKLSISQPCDSYEQEAERVSNQVMQMPNPASAGMRHDLDQPQTSNSGSLAPTVGLAASITPLVERAPSEAVGESEPGADFETRLGSNDGSPLSPETRAFMEPRFGADFSRVRVHTGSEAAQLSRAIHARAFTYGEHIYLGEGKSDVGSSSDKQLLAHELTHSIQQGAAGDGPHRNYFSSVSRSPIVQRDPITGPPAANAPPGAAPVPSPAPATTDPKAPEGGWSLKGILDGTQKVKFGVGSHTLFSEQAGKRFGWSTERVPGKGPAVPLALGVIPLPLPVGPLEIEVNAGVSAYAGGNALLDLKVNDVKLEATAGDLARIGAAAFLTVVPVGGPVLPLAMLASLRLRGEGTLSAKAKATLSAGADGFINGLVNPLLWPAALFARGSLGVAGSITVEAPFEGPVQVEFHLGRLRILGGSYRAGTRLAADLALKAALSIGVVVGYRPLTSEHQLWSVDGGASMGIDISSFVEGAKFATLTANDDGTPEVDLEKLLINGKALIQAMFGKRNPGNDVVRPYPPGQAPEGQPPAALELPASKAHHLAKYRGLLGELHHVPGRVRKTNQVGKWVSSLKAEISPPIYERAIDLGLLDQPGDATNPPDHNELFNRARKDDSPVFVPFWSRTRQFATAMGVDHIVEWQVYPTALVDEPWNFELLDPSSNSSAGSGLDANLDRLRSTLPPEWQARILVFTDVVAPVAGRLGETWSHEEILNGAHLDVYQSGRFGPKRPRPASP